MRWRRPESVDEQVFACTERDVGDTSSLQAPEPLRDGHLSVMFNLLQHDLQDEVAANLLHHGAQICRF